MLLERKILGRKFEAIQFLGDVHGTLKALMCINNHIDRFELKNTAFIQVGDFGMGFEKRNLENKRLGALNKKLGENNCSLYVYRGNHDKPKYFKDQKKRPKYSHIEFLDDFTVLSLEADRVYNILVIGGALSIDRKIKAAEGHWWPDEKVNFKDNYDFLKERNDIDVLGTHTAPNFLPPFGASPTVVNYAKEDINLYGELSEERHKMAELVDLIIDNNKNLSYHFYGHFHFSEYTIYRDVKFICLSIEEFYSFL
jgi:hypothetical protein